MNLRSQIKNFLLGLTVVGAGVAFAATFNQFSPATGVLKGNASSYITTAAVSADIRGLWTGTCNASTFLRGDGACAVAGAGTVTSVALSMPTGLSVAGSPITTSGTFSVTTVLNGPVRGNGSGLITGNTSLTSEVSGVLPVANGGIGVGTLTGIAKGNGTSAFSAAVSSDVTSLWSGTCNASSFLRGDGACAAAGAGTVTSISAGTGISLSPNPIVSTGTASVDQTFSPSWTGTHQFKGAPTRAGTTSMLSPGLVSSNVPLISMTDGSAASDKKSVEIFNSGGTFTIQNINEAASTTRAVMVANRGTGAAISSLVFGNSTDNAPFTISGTGLVSMGGSSPAAGSNVSIGIGTAGPGTAANRGDLYLNGATDAILEFGASGSRSAYIYANATEFRLLGEASRTLTFYANNTQQLKIDTDGSWDLGGSTPGTSGQVLTSNGSGSAPTWQNGAAETSGTFDATFDDACTTSPTITFDWVKIGSLVTMIETAQSGLSCTSDSTAFATTGTPVPSSIRPTAVSAVEFRLSSFATDNGASASKDGCFQVTSAGNIQFGVTGSGVTCSIAGWTAAGSKNAARIGYTVSWHVANP